MKKLLFTITLFYSLNLFAQNANTDLISQLTTTANIDDCFISSPILNEGKQSKKGFLITVYPAIIETTKLIFKEEDRLKKEANKDLEFEVSPPYTYYTLRELNVNKDGNSKFDGDGFCLCVKEKEGIKTTIKNKKIGAAGLVVPIQKLTKKASVTKELLDRKPKQLAPNQYWFKTQNWTPLEKIDL